MYLRQSQPQASDCRLSILRALFEAFFGRFVYAAVACQACKITLVDWNSSSFHVSILKTELTVTGSPPKDS
jgi:hypothetical protein